MLLLAVTVAAAVRMAPYAALPLASIHHTPPRVLLPRSRAPQCALGESTGLQPDATAGDASAGRAAAAPAYFKPLQQGDVLESTPKHQAICATAALLICASLGKAAFLFAAAPPSLGWLAFSLLAGFEFADFGSGVYHWAMDNYGNANTPIWGKQIEAFQGHHERPWTITHRQTCNNLHQSALATMPPLLCFLLLVGNVVGNAYVLLWGTVAMTFIMLAQELHKWSHTMASQLSPMQNALQNAGLIVSRKGHLAHHKPPFENNYCIVTGHCNELLDRAGFFPWLERLVHRINGIEPRSWTQERFEFDGLVAASRGK